MVEGDPRIVEWQVWDARNVEPGIPDGLAAGGPWFPFALGHGVMKDRGGFGDIAMVAVYRRPLVRLSDAARGDAWKGGV